MLDCALQMFLMFSIYPQVLSILLAVDAELDEGDDDGHGQAAQQHHKDAADVLHTQGIRLALL